MHLHKYPLLSALVVPMPGADLDTDADTETDLAERVGFERELDQMRRRRGRIGEAIAPAYAFLEKNIGDDGLQSRLASEPRTLDLPVPTDAAARSRRAEVYSSALALAWLPSPSLALRQRLGSWVAARSMPRGPIPFFDSPQGGCVETTGMALLGLFRAGMLEAGMQKASTDAILRSGSAAHHRKTGEQAIFGSTWWRPPGSSEGRTDPGTVVQALFPVLLGLRQGRLRLVDPIPLDDEGTGGSLVVAEAVQQNLDLVRAYLESDRVHEGTARYPSPEVLLCLATELWRSTTPLSASLRTPLERAVSCHWQAVHGDQLGVLERAALSIAAENLHLGHVDLERARLELVEQQLPDGSFPASPFLYFEESELNFGSRALTTIFALRAISGQPRSGMWSR